jgi:hypothetical protein
MKVVVVRVRDGDDVDRADERSADPLAMPVQRAETVLEQRVGQNAHPVELDEDGRVTEEAQRGLRRHSRSVVRDG